MFLDCATPTRQLNLYSSSQGLLIVATGTYASIMGSPQLYCNVAAQESFVPIRMRGFNAEQANDFRCPT